MAKVSLDEALRFPSDASIDQVEHWLAIFVNCSYNNDGAFLYNGIYYKYDFQVVGSLNARYRELTGQSYPEYAKKQYEMAKFFKHKRETNSRVYKDIIVDLKENEPSKMFLTANHPIFRLNDIMLDLDKATAEEIGQILEIYQSKKYLVSGQADLKPIIVDGCGHIMHYEPVTAAALNNRYYELTGQNYPSYVKEQTRVIKMLLREQKRFGGLITNNDVYQEILKGLEGKESELRFVSSYKDYTSTGDIQIHPEQYGLEDLNKYLNSLNQKAIVSGTVTYGPNDPVTASKINARYHELTGQDHPMYIAQIPKMLANYFKDRALLEPHLTPSYYNQLEAIASNLGLSFEEKHKNR